MEAPVKLYILLVLTINTLHPLCTTGTENNGDNLSRRTLHEPLFPTDPPPSPTQPFPSTPSTPSQDSPFFPPAPPVQPQNQTQTQTISLPSNVSDHTRVQNGSVKPAGKIFIGVSISIMAMVLVLVSACFIHHRRHRNSAESEKLVGRGDAIRHQNGSGNHNQIPQPGMSSGSHFLYIGTVEPTQGRSEEMKGSPYHRLSESNHRIDYHRPSPELQPLPPLSGQQERSPPITAMTSDEEESYHTAKASLAGSDFSPHRLALPRNFGNSTNTNTTSNSINRSSTSTNSSTNTTASFDKADRAPPAARPAVESPSMAIRLITAPSPKLQPMTVPKQLPSSQTDTRVSFRSTASPITSLPAPPMQAFQGKIQSSPASPPLTPMQAFQTKMAQKVDLLLPSPPPPPPPPPPPRAFQTKRKIQSLSMPPVPPPPPIQSLRTRMAQKVQESPPSSPPPAQSSQANVLRETQSRSTPPPPPPPPHAPSPPPRPPSSALQLQHPVLNKNRLPEPCPPPMAACPQDRAETLAPKTAKSDRTELVSTGPASNANLHRSPKKVTEAENDNLKPRLKPLHWDKVRASSDRAMVWDRLKSSSFK